MPMVWSIGWILLKDIVSTGVGTKLEFILSYQGIKNLVLLSLFFIELNYFFDFIFARILLTSSIFSSLENNSSINTGNISNARSASTKVYFSSPGFVVLSPSHFICFNSS